MDTNSLTRAYRYGFGILPSRCLSSLLVPSKEEFRCHELRLATKRIELNLVIGQ
jgi:hypothetical protein